MQQLFQRAIASRTNGNSRSSSNSKGNLLQESICLLTYLRNNNERTLLFLDYYFRLN